MNFSLVSPTQFAEIHKEMESDPQLQTLIHQASNSRARCTVLYTTTAHETSSPLSTAQYAEHHKLLPIRSTAVNPNPQFLKL